MRRERGPVKAPPSIGMVRPLAAVLSLLFLLNSCGDGGEPVREEIDGIEYVKNRIRPADGTTLPEPRPAEGLLMLEGGSEGRPGWSSIRDVRLRPDGSLIVLDTHRTEVTWFDNEGHLLVIMDLSLSGLGLTSPVALAFNDAGDGSCVDMALRRALSFSAEGARLASFRIGAGLPMDLDLGIRGDLYILTLSHPDEGREHLLQVRRYGVGGAPLTIADRDSLLIEHISTANQPTTAPMSISVNPLNTLYAAGRGYVIHQAGQRRDVLLTETVAIVQLVALDRGGVLVQTNEWHPSMLDNEIGSRNTTLLLDQFSRDGTFDRRYAVVLPTPYLDVRITDEAGGFLCGYGVPMTGEGPLRVLRFRLPEDP